MPIPPPDARNHAYAGRTIHSTPYLAAVCLMQWESKLGCFSTARAFPFSRGPAHLGLEALFMPWLDRLELSMVPHGRE
jgi:hypothetical protein